MQNPRLDPNKNPHQPQTGYKLFVREQMHKIKESEQDLTTQEMMQYCQREWDRLTPQQKMDYEVRAGDERANQVQSFNDFRRGADP